MKSKFKETRSKWTNKMGPKEDDHQNWRLKILIKNKNGRKYKQIILGKIKGHK